MTELRHIKIGTYIRNESRWSKIICFSGLATVFFAIVFPPIAVITFAIFIFACAIAGATWWTMNGDTPRKPEGR
jgi:hypothetical protein